MKVRVVTTVDIVEGSAAIREDVRQYVQNLATEQLTDTGVLREG